MQLEYDVFPDFYKQYECLLNGDPPKQKGITLKILKYIAENEEIVHFDDLRKQFPQVKNMRKKMEQLRKADCCATLCNWRKSTTFATLCSPWC